MCLRWPFFLQICHLSSRRSPKPVIWHLGLCLARTLHITNGSKYSGSSEWPPSLSWLSPWQGHVPVRVQEAPASCEGILHPSGGDAAPGIATAVCAFAYANYCLQHCSSARECSLGCGSPQAELAWGEVQWKARANALESSSKRSQCWVFFFPHWRLSTTCLGRHLRRNKVIT